MEFLQLPSSTYNTLKLTIKIDGYSCSEVLLVYESFFLPFWIKYTHRNVFVQLKPRLRSINGIAYTFWLLSIELSSTNNFYDANWKFDLRLLKG